MRVIHRGICRKCCRSNQTLVFDSLCRSCAKGTADAAATTALLVPKENSTAWAKEWKPLNSQAEARAEMEAQRRLGMAVEESPED
jgi:hypothetical protein